MVKNINIITVTTNTTPGAVHKVRHAIFGQFWPPLSHFVTHRGPPSFLLGLAQKTRQKPSVQILSQLFVGFFQGVFSQEGFVRSPSVRIYLLQQKDKHHFKFQVSYVSKKIKSVTSQALDLPPPVTNCHTFSDPLPLERDVLDGPQNNATTLYNS